MTPGQTLRILYFTRDYTPHDYRFLTALAGSENQVYSLRLERRNQQLEDRPLPLQVEQIIWRGGQQPFHWRDLLPHLASLRKVIGRVKPDLIHAGPIQTTAFLTALSGFHPQVSMSWGSDLLIDAEKSRWVKWATRFTLNHSDILLGDCQAVGKKAQDFGFSSGRIMLFPWGVDLSQFSPQQGADDLRQRLGWQDAFVLLSLRSWEPLYGVDVLVRAFARTAREMPDLRLLLLGNGSQAALLRRILLDNRVEDRVYFGGQVSNQNLPAFYRSADLYISASHSDGSSVSLMEALACGRAVLVSDIPGNREWIEPGRQGWLFPDGDEEALAEGIIQAYHQREQLQQMGCAARILAEQRADWSKNFQKLLKAYEMAVMINQKSGSVRL